MSIAYASEQLEKKFPADGSLVFARQGEALFRENWTDECIKLLMEGTRTHQKYVTGYLVLGRIYKEMGRLVEAQHALQEALRLDPRCPSALRMLAEICEGLQAYGESARHLEKLASLEPWDAEFQSAYQRTLDRSGGPAQASAAPAEAPATGEFAGGFAEFLPKDEASLDTVFGFGSETQFTAARPEPNPMDVLREGTDTPQESADIVFMPPGEEAIGATDTAYVPSAPVEGADIEKRLDDLFSLETPVGDETRPGSETATVEVAPTPVEPAPVSTQNQAPITGDDVEKQLDELFFPSEATAVGTRHAAPPQPPAKPHPEFAGLDDRTVALPAFRPPKPLPVAEPEVAKAPPDAKPDEETVVEAVELREALETGVVEIAAPDPDAVVGEDIGQRLDQLFGAEDAGATAYADAAVDEPGTSETATFASGAAATLAVDRKADKEDDSKVSGDDIEARISQIFEVRDVAPESPPAPPEDVSGATQTLGLPRDLVFGGEKARPELLPASEPRLSMEEPQLRMEEEVAEALSDAETAAATPPNVATVTLAEIYFQQGLKEQALQIYRQLLEREPENETARKRIQEIESAKSEGEARQGGGEADRRAPRPGVKVPRRKK